MLKKEELHVLICSLSKSEKRYFKLFCQREASGGNYLKLFDAISQQKVYDEQQIKAQLADERFVTQLHVTKNYLRKLILQALRQYHATISKDAMLKEQLRNIEILYQKELYSLAESELKKAEATAERYELLAGVIEIKAWKRKLAQTRSPSDYMAIGLVVEEQKAAISKAENLLQYWQLSIKAYASFLEDPAFVPLPPLLRDSTKALSLEAKVLYYNTIYLHHLKEKNHAQAEAALLGLVDYMEGMPDRIQEEPGLYMSTVNNLLGYWVSTKKYTEAQVQFEKARVFLSKWQIGAGRTKLLKQIIRTYSLELEMYREVKNLQGRTAILSAAEIFVDTYEAKMPSEYYHSFCFQLAATHFHDQSYSPALRWIHRLLNAKTHVQNHDMLVQSKLLSLMIHLEQQNMMVLGYFVESTKRYLKKAKQLRQFETVLLNFFLRMPRLPLDRHREAFQSLYHELFPPDKPSLIPPSATNYIDYRAWLEGKC